jgi:hypothetical protein
VAGLGHPLRVSFILLGWIKIFMFFSPQGCYVRSVSSSGGKVVEVSRKV